jgi:hypothetical protein
MGKIIERFDKDTSNIQYTKIEIAIRDAIESLEVQIEDLQDVALIDNAGYIPPKQVIVFPYPPIIEINGQLFETLDYMTLIKLVYSMRERINALEALRNNSRQPDGEKG